MRRTARHYHTTDFSRSLSTLDRLARYRSRYLLHGVAAFVGVAALTSMAFIPHARHGGLSIDPPVVDAAPAPAMLALDATLPAPDPTAEPTSDAAADPVTNQPVNDVLEASIAPPEPPKPLAHTVEEGETVRMLAAKYGISPETIMAANGIRNPDLLQVGQDLIILPTDGVLYTVRQGESIEKVAERFSVDPDDIIHANDPRTRSGRGAARHQARGTRRHARPDAPRLDSRSPVGRRYGEWRRPGSGDRWQRRQLARRRHGHRGAQHAHLRSSAWRHARRHRQHLRRRRRRRSCRTTASTIPTPSILAAICASCRSRASSTGPARRDARRHRLQVPGRPRPAARLQRPERSRRHPRRRQAGRSRAASCALTLVPAPAAPAAAVAAASAPRTQSASAGNAVVQVPAPKPAAQAPAPKPAPKRRRTSAHPRCRPAAAAARSSPTR